MQTPLKLITHLFPVWACLLSAIAFYFPALFAALKPGSQRTPTVFILSNFAFGSSRHSLAGGHHVRHGLYGCDRGGVESATGVVNRHDSVCASNQLNLGGHHL